MKKMKKNYQLIHVIAVSVATFLIASCSKDSLVDSMNASGSSIVAIDVTENGTNPDDANLSSVSAKQSTNGYLYTESNDAGLNSILMYVMDDGGSLSLQSTTNSGGAGAGVGLGSQGAIALDDANEWLFAVNAGGNSISSFMINADGNLTLASTISSGGEMPVSIDVWGNYLYVTNFLSSNINGYMIGADGSLTAIAGSNLTLSTDNAQPAQIKFNPSGNVIYVTEKHTNRITEYLINNAGMAHSKDWRHSSGVEPFGFDFARDIYMVVSNAEAGVPNATSVTSYMTSETGLVNDVNGAIPSDQTAACWVAVTYHGRYALVTNTGSNTISSYYINGLGQLTLVQATAATTDAGPLDITMLGNYYVYTLNGEGQTIGEYVRESAGGLTNTGSETDVPAFAAGLVGF